MISIKIPVAYLHVDQEIVKSFDMLCSVGSVEFVAEQLGVDPEESPIPELLNMARSEPADVFQAEVEQLLDYQDSSGDNLNFLTMPETYGVIELGGTLTLMFESGTFIRRLEVNRDDWGLTSIGVAWLQEQFLDLNGMLFGHIPENPPYIHADLSDFLVDGLPFVKSNHTVVDTDQSPVDNIVQFRSPHHSDPQ